MSLIKTAEEIKQLREDGKVLASVLKYVKEMVKPGITPAELNSKAEELIYAAGGKPSFKGYGQPIPFPAGLCVSVNEEIVHGIPGDRVLKEGDIVSLDIGMDRRGLFTDMATTVAVGGVPKHTKELMKVTHKCLELGIKECKVGNTLGDIGYAIQTYAEKNGFGVVRDLVGHGVGHAVHEAPSVPNFGRKGMGEKLQEGMVLALEPMITVGSYDIDYCDDDWTIKTRDNSLSCHYEHTVAITKDGPIIITEL
ncbi:type I methionyl aminopeptidase [Patescibacteria group bacterium]|nr:type I methionyl aminopeptidase [Patescibacteria group bacterium]